MKSSQSKLTCLNVVHSGCAVSTSIELCDTIRQAKNWIHESKSLSIALNIHLLRVRITFRQSLPETWMHRLMTVSNTSTCKIMNETEHLYFEFSHFRRHRCIERLLRVCRKSSFQVFSFVVSALIVKNSPLIQNWITSIDLIFKAVTAFHDFYDSPR